jgi:hypothetical protein
MSVPEKEVTLLHPLTQKYLVSCYELYTIVDEKSEVLFFISKESAILHV